MNPETLPLRDIHLPAAISWWPLAPGWWLVLAVTLLVLAGIAWWVFKRFQRVGKTTPVTTALTELTRLQREYAHDSQALLREISVLLRRIAISQYGRQTVSGLTGSAWVTFLDQQVGKPVFAGKFDRLLTELPYCPAVQVEMAAFIQAVREWIKLQGERKHV